MECSRNGIHEALCVPVSDPLNLQGKEIVKILYVALALARTLDAGTTCKGLAMDGQPVPNRPGYVYSVKDIYPWNANCPSVIGLQGGFAVMQIYSIHALHRKHPRAAKWLAVTAIGVEGFAVAWNVNQLRKVR